MLFYDSFINEKINNTYVWCVIHVVLSKLFLRGFTIVLGIGIIVDWG